MHISPFIDKMPVCLVFRDEEMVENAERKYKIEIEKKGR